MADHHPSTHTHITVDMDKLNQQTITERLSFLEDRMSATSTTAFLPLPPNSARVANTGPLGLFAFGYTSALLAVTYTKWADGGSVQWSAAYGLFYGGLVQLLAGMWAVWARNTFAGTAFSSYGAFWMGFGIYEILNAGGVLTAVEPQGEQTFLALWAVFTFCLLVQTANINIALMVMFLFLTLTFALLAAGPNHPRVIKAGGYFAIAAALMAFYTALAELTNEVYRKTLLPLGILNLVTAQPKYRDPRPDTL